jgi:uncharacterized membrane protein (DUF4010 family)
MDPLGVPLSMAQLAGRLAVALGVGLLLGAERERRKGDDHDTHRAAAGIRTFALVALLGALSLTFDSLAVLVLAGVFVAGAALLSYLRSAPEDPGLTSEVALFLAFLLGALAVRQPILAAGLATVVTMILAARSRLHHLVSHALSEREFHDALLFLGAALVVLPMAPNRGFGPGAAFNPFTVWRLVVIVMSLSALGYGALRLLGPRFGLPMAGFFGGFVSSTATIGTMGARARGDERLFSGAVAGAVLSTVATVVFLAMVIGATSLALLRALAPILGAAGMAALLFAAVFTLRATRADGLDGETLERQAPDSGRAFDLRTATVLGFTVSAILIAATFLNRQLGSPGLLLATGVAGFADVQSAAISASTLVASGAAGVADAVLAVLIAFTTNTVSKLVAAAATGTGRYVRIVGGGLLLVLAAAWGAWFWIR